MKETFRFSFSGGFEIDKRNSLNPVRHFACGENYFFRWPTISPDIVRRSSRVRFFSIAGVSNETCGISQRCSAMNQIGFSVVIQLR